MNYFDREGKPLGVVEWATLSDRRSYQFVAMTTLSDPDTGETIDVCTDWIGIDYSFGRSSMPYTFETQIFGGALSLAVRRYPTAEAAERGHVGAVVRAGLAMAGVPWVSHHPHPDAVSHADGQRPPTGPGDR